MLRVGYTDAVRAGLNSGSCSVADHVVIFSSPRDTMLNEPAASAAPETNIWSQNGTCIYVAAEFSLRTLPSAEFLQIKQL
jgi:hypothetical protein